MAKKLSGHIFFIGRMDPIQVYMSCGKCIVRSVSSLTGKRVKTDKKFMRTMQNADLLGRASRIASFVYRELPAEFRQFWMYRAFTGEVIHLLRKGMSNKDARMILWKTYAEIWVLKKEQALKKPASIERNKVTGISSLVSIVSLYGQKHRDTSTSKKNRLKRYLLVEKRRVSTNFLLESNCLPP